MQSRNFTRISSYLFRLKALRLTVAVVVVAFIASSNASAQETTPPQETVREGFTVHQSIDVGGRITELTGSLPMYDTLVNLHSGPRIFEQTLDLHAVPGARHFFLYDSLLLTNTGYGGDPENVTLVRASKGKLYDFQGLFRRDRQYFDYNLLDNPLIPLGVTSNGYTFPQVQHSPHLFNTVRRMTDTNLTLLPLAKLTFRMGYSQNINQGPSFSSFHNGAEPELLQNWRNSTDTWFGAADFKRIPRTLLTFQETISHYKGDTNIELATPAMQLPNGAGPATLGYDQVEVPKCADGNPAILDSTTNPPTINPTCSGYQQLTRISPTRTLFPTEELRFQTAAVKNLQMNGRFRYTGASMNLPQFNEHFLGLDNQGIRQWDITGYAKAERVNVSGDFGASWKISPRFSLSEQYDFSSFRQPADSYLSEADVLGTSMLDAPGAAQDPVITAAHTFLGQKIETNTTRLIWKQSSWASLSVGYRYRSRTLRYAMPLVTDWFLGNTDYTLPIHENGGLFGAVLHPTAHWKIDGTVEVAYLDNAYVQPDPRQLQHYQVHTMWTPTTLVTITGAFDDLERHDGQALVNHKDHSRSAGLGAQIAINEHYSLDLNYGYFDVFTTTGICYRSSLAPAGTPLAPQPDCGTNTFLGTFSYDEPTQYGSVDLMYSPVKKLQSHLGYRMNAVNGSTTTFNPRQVPGSLQSQYQTPFANVTWTVTHGFGLRGEWNYFDYGEQAPVGPTAPRDFHTNLYNLGIHYEF
jgi:hypothetical protein